MKKIFSISISISESYNEYDESPIYQLEEESTECEFSETWFVSKNDPADDPIKEYVENAVQEVNDKTLDELGYSWDGKDGNINFVNFSTNMPYHILFFNKKPVELFYIEEVKNDEE